MSNFSQHFDELTVDVKSRYLSKISCIRNIDPYTLRNGSKDIRDFPAVSCLDIVHYLVYEKSAFSKEEFKNVHSLEAFKNFKAGYMKNLECYKINEYCVLLSQVTHSQRVKKAPTNTWVICKSSGEVSSAHCQCVAGLGEVCSHVATTLFAIEDAVRTLNEGSSVTDSPAYWKPPSGSLGSMSAVKDIHYKADLESDDEQPDNFPQIQEPDDEKKRKFLQRLHDKGENCGAFYVFEPFCKLKKDSCGLVKCLYNPEYDSKSLEELIQIGKKIQLQIEDTKAIQKLTIGQHTNKKWHELREGRITASLFKLVCRTNLMKPSMSLLKRIAYPSSVSFRSKQTTYGCDHEKEAIEKYACFIKEKHFNFQMSQTGLIVNNKYPCLGASPDSMIQCDCCGEGVLEVKCPYCARDGDLGEEIVALKASFLTASGTGVQKYSLSHKHAYYFQVQMQMALAEVSYSDFFVWNRSQFLYERIYFDQIFWSENVAKALLYHEKIVMPEILGRYFTNLYK